MFTLRINTDNAAFFDDEDNHDPGREVANILRTIAARIEHGAISEAESWEMHLNDTNGNKVGIARFEE